MPQIPFELQKIKAQQIYEQRLAEGKSGTPENDWLQAKIKLEQNPLAIRAWIIKQFFGSNLKRLWRLLNDLINLIGKIITFPFWLFNKLPSLFSNQETRPFALDVVKTIISIFSLVATIIAAIGLFVNYQSSVQDRLLNEERLVTDRFTKAVEQLGNEKEEVVIGGIYSLERITKDSPKYQWTIMEVLTAFVRKNSPIPSEIQALNDSKAQSKALEKLKSVGISVQAALTVIGRRNPDQDDIQENKEIKVIDLSNSNLSDAKLSYAKLFRAKLSNANLSEANLFSADLYKGNLIGASLIGADLSYAKLSYANLSSANLSDAKLSSANLFSANLSSANLSDTNLSSANLNNQQIKSACFWEQAIYANSEWNSTIKNWVAIDQQANRQKIEEIRQDKASDPQNPPDCS